LRTLDEAGRSTKRAAAPAHNEAVTHRLLDVREAAAMLAIKPATLYQWTYQRRIPVVKLNGRLLFQQRDDQAASAAYDRAGRTAAWPASEVATRV